MKKLFILFLSLLFVGCATGPRLLTMENYDKTTFDKIDFSDAKILGEIKVITLLPVWETFSATDKKANQIMEKLEKKALKKYGEKIRLIDVNISEKNILGNGLLYGTGTAVYIFGASGIDPETEEFKSPAYPILTLGGVTTFFFKVVTSTATVIEADSPLQGNKFTLVSEKEIEDKRTSYLNEQKTKAALALLETQKKAAEEEKRLEEERIAAERKAAEEQKRIEEERIAAERKAAEEQKEKIREQTKQHLIDRAKKNNAPLAFIAFSITDINSVGGVNIGVTYINTSDKIIKYIYLDLLPYNRVFDPLPSEIKTITATNFVLPSKDVYSRWKNVWYNSTLIDFDIVKIKVVFIDDSEVVIEDKAIIKEVQFTHEESKLYTNPLGLLL